MESFTDFDVDSEITAASGEFPSFRYNNREYTFSEDEAKKYDDVVLNFISAFYYGWSQSSRDLQTLYEADWNRLSEKHLKEKPWPPAESIAALVQNDQVFLLLYKELSFRHLFYRSTPSIEQRVESWNNYTDLFKHIIETEGKQLRLPKSLQNQWLWDIIDEFVFQFQSHCQYQSKLAASNSTAEKELLAKLQKATTKAWNVFLVLGTLQSLVTESRIAQFLQRDRQSSDADKEVTPLKILGFFSTIELLRLHCLLGDYHSALRSIDPLDLTSKGWHTSVTACHVTLYYYVGFAYFMMQRYVDATKTFSNILLYLGRTRMYHQDQGLGRKQEQIFHLLALTVSLIPQRIDEHLHASLRDKLGDKISRSQKGDESAIKELFCFGCPKFVTINPNELAQEAWKGQYQIFIKQVNEQISLPVLKSFLKLYTTISTNKLAQFTEVDEETLKTQLLNLKHKSRTFGWNGGPALSSALISSTSDIDFYISKDMVHITTIKVPRRYGEFFMKHIVKFEEILSSQLYI